MIHETYMPVYRCPDFHCVRTGGRAGSPEVVQEALADLKIRMVSISGNHVHAFHTIWPSYLIT